MIKTLFSTEDWTFEDTGVAWNHPHEGVLPLANRRWIVELDDYGVSAMWWLWDDETMSLCGDAEQRAYRAYLATLILGPGVGVP